jgi:hypothetical protein
MEPIQPRPTWHQGKHLLVIISLSVFDEMLLVHVFTCFDRYLHVRKGIGNICLVWTHPTNLRFITNHKEN